jgi:hypothetical protein
MGEPAHTRVPARRGRSRHAPSRRDMADMADMADKVDKAASGGRAERAGKPESVPCDVASLDG